MSIQPTILAALVLALLTVALATDRVTPSAAGGDGSEVIVDNFDDNSLADVWSPDLLSGTGASMSETNGRLEFHIDAAAQGSMGSIPGDPFNTVSTGVRHRCALAGDFDLYLEFNLTQWPKENGMRLAFEIGTSQGGIAIQRSWDAVFGNLYNTGTHLIAASTSDTSGRMRIARTGSMATSSFDSGGSWQALRTVDIGDGNASFDIRAFTHDHLLAARPEESQEMDITLTVDNVTLAGGTLTCGEKIELTQAIQELQDVPDLLADLDDDGEPPVPLVAGKPLALRVYFDEPDSTVGRTVELSGVASGSETHVIGPGCDVEKRRKQEDGCKSADFFFTPPEGEWTATVDVRDGTSLALLSRAELTVKSVEADDLTLRSVRVCDSVSLIGDWRCGDPLRLTTLGLYLEKVAPTGDFDVAQSGHVVRRLINNYPNPKAWWGDMVLDVQNLYTIWDSAAQLFDVQRYYFGMVHQDVPGLLGKAADIPGRGGAAKSHTSSLGIDDSDLTTAHEVGHMLGVRHTDKEAPAAQGNVAPGCYAKAPDSQSDWIYADNKIQSGPAAQPSVEVGFDVGAKKALPGDKVFELMGYCAPQWVSPRTYLLMLKALGVDVPQTNVQGSVTIGQHWLVSGTIDGSTSVLRPLFQLAAESTVGSGFGEYRIEVRDAGQSVLFSRSFVPFEVSAKVGPGDSDEPFSAFSELVPVQAGATQIVIFDETESEIGEIELSGKSPEVSITQVAEAVSVADSVQIAWSVDDADSGVHTYWVDYSPDGGETWFNQGMGLTETSLALPVETLAGSDNAIVRILASDGVNTGMAVSEPFSVAKKLPEAEILFPESGNVFEPGDLVWLQGLAFDADDLELDEASIEWTSSRDGALGTGDDLPVYDLSEGTHTITLTVRDSDDNTATDSIVITVGEGGLLWGDNNCSGAVDPVDSLLTLRHDAGLSTNTGECPEMGDEVAGGYAWGDIDCSAGVDPVDALKLLRFDAGLSVAKEESCPDLGALT